MKLIINYDLIDKVNEANHEFQLQRSLSKFFGVSLGIYSGFAISNLLFNSNHEVEWALNLLYLFNYFAIATSLEALTGKVFTYNIKKSTYLKLAKLSLQLYDLHSNTSPKLLKESILLQTEYQVKWNEKYFPIISTKKYILVPTYDGLGNIRNTSILQKHDMGSKEYVLSIGNPKKISKLVPTYNV